MKKEVYDAKDIAKILGRSTQYAYDLIYKLQRMLHRENPDYLPGVTATIPVKYFNKKILGE